MKSLVEACFALLAMVVFLFGTAPKPDPLLAQALAERDHWASLYTKTSNELAAVMATTPTRRPAEDVIEIYNEHQEEVDAIWLSMACTATLEDAVLQWQKRPTRVGLPPDTVHLTNGVITSQPPTPKFPHEPTPALPVKTVAFSKPAAQGHYEVRGRGRRTYQVWVPHAAPAACANGSCAPRQMYYSGASGSCRSCR